MTSLVGFYGELAPETRQSILAAGEVVRFKKNAMLISHLDENCDVFITLNGRAAATVYSYDGKMVAYRTIEAGAIFGELSAIDGEPRSASIEALTMLEVVRLSPDAFSRLIDDELDFTRALMRHLARQARTMTDRIYEFSTMVARSRLAAELLRLAAAGTGDVISPAPTHHELASRISSHREAVSREMSQFAREGLLQKIDGQLEILDTDGLRRCV